MKYPIGFSFYYRAMEYTIAEFHPNEEKQYRVSVKVDIDDDQPFLKAMSETELENSVAKEQLAEFKAE